MMGFGPTLAFLLLAVPSTVVAAAASGHGRAAPTLVSTNGGAGRSIAHSRRSFALASHEAQTCNSGCPTPQMVSLLLSLRKLEGFRVWNPGNLSGARLLLPSMSSSSTSVNYPTSGVHSLSDRFGNCRLPDSIT